MRRWFSGGHTAREIELRAAKTPMQKWAAPAEGTRDEKGLKGRIRPPVERGETAARAARSAAPVKRHEDLPPHVASQKNVTHDASAASGHSLDPDLPDDFYKVDVGTLVLKLPVVSPSCPPLRSL